MTQIVLFTIGYVVSSLGALLAVITSASDSAAPKPGPVTSLLLMILGLGAIVAGASAG